MRLGHLADLSRNAQLQVLGDTEVKAENLPVWEVLTEVDELLPCSGRSQHLIRKRTIRHSWHTGSASQHNNSQ